MSQFANVTKKLIQGGFICQYSHPADFDFLKKPGMAAEIDNYFRKLEFSLSITNDGEGYYCSYVYPKENILALKRQFAEIIESMSPLVTFLIMVQQSKASDDVIKPGDVLRMTQIQETVEDTPSLSVYLDKIASHSLFKSVSPTVDGKLKLIFKKLVDMDYLVSSNPSHQIYTATHKWSLLMEQIRFINETENLALESQVENNIKQNDLYE